MSSEAQPRLEKRATSTRNLCACVWYPVPLPGCSQLPGDKAFFSSVLQALHAHTKLRSKSKFFLNVCTLKLLLYIV